MTEYDNFQGWCILAGDRSLQRAVGRQVIKTVDRYQLHQLDSAIKKTTKRRVAIDIGAHYGVMTRNLAKLFDTVHAFEIDPAVCDCLERNMKKFSVDNAVIHRCGLGDCEAQVGLHVKQGKTFSTHVDLSATEYLVPVYTLDSFDIADVDLIKIDAEGFEPLIVQGAIETIKTCNPVILYESKGHENRYGHDSDFIINILSSLGYKKAYLDDLKNTLIMPDR